MSQQPYVARARGRVALAYIGGKYALSTPVLILTFFLSGLNNLIFDHRRLGGSILAWLGVAVLSHMMMLIAVLPIRLTILPVKDRKSKPFVALGVFAFAGAFRGVCSNFIAQWMDLQEDSEILFRGLGGINYFVLMASLSTILVAVSVEHRNVMSSLSKEQQQLRAMKNSIRGQVAEQRRQILEQIHHVLDPRVSQFRVLLEESKSLPDSSKVLADTQKLVADIVRPLSHRIIESADRADIPTSNIGYQTNQKFDHDRRYQVEALILPTFLTLAVMQISLASLLVTLDYEQGLRVWIIAGVTTYLVLRVAKVILGQLATSIWMAGVIVLGVHVAAALVLDSGGELFNAQIPTALRGYLYVFPTSLGVATMAFLVRQGQRVTAVEETKEANAQLGLLISGLRQELWINRRRLALILHGPVQGALYAAAIKLGRAETLAGSVVDEVQADLTEALKQLDEVSKFDPTVIRQQFADIADLWFGTCNVSFAVSNSVYDVMVAHPHAAECVLEIAQEAIVNAIKHGEASRIDVTIHNRSAGVLTVVIENDGNQGTGNVLPGLGTRILDEITHTWKRDFTARGVVLTAEVSLADS